MIASKEGFISEITAAKNVVIQNVGSDIDMSLNYVIQVLSKNQSTFPNLNKLLKIALYSSQLVLLLLREVSLLREK